MTNAKIIPFHKPSLGEEEIFEVVDSIKSGWISTGPKTQKFERAFRDYLGVTYAVALNSGTAALHLALEVIGVGEGDEVITTPYTFVSTSEAILLCGATPVYVDCDPKSFNILADRIEAKITPRTKAILPVHFGGQACDMDLVMDVAGRHKLTVIEDAAHSFPARFKGRLLGTIGDMASFSFYATKPLAMGEGGMLVTNHEAYARKAKLLSLHGIDKDPWSREFMKRDSWRYLVTALGHKYNLSDIQSSLGIHQLAKAEQLLERRREVAKAYNEAFRNFDLLETPWVRNFKEHAWHLYVVRLNLERLDITRDHFIEKLKERGIGASVHFIPLHLHPYYVRRFGFKPNDFPNARACSERVVSLPIYPGMTDGDVRYVIEHVTSVLEESRNVRFSNSISNAEAKF